MTDKEGTLKIQPYGRWASAYRGKPGEYYSIDGYHLHDGLRAAFLDHRER